MLSVPYNLNFISRKIARSFVKEATETYMRKISEYRELPENVKALEARFKAQGYKYESPMTNEEFKEMARKQLGEEKGKDPLEVNNLAEKIKTAYTNHYLEYMNKKQTIARIPEIVKQFEDQISFYKTWKPNRLQKLLSYIGL